MSAISAPAEKHSEIDRLCRLGEFQQALDAIYRMLREDPLDRTTRLYELLIRIVQNGPDGCEVEIENLRAHTDLTDQEKNLVRKILVVCYDVAEKQQDLAKIWSYQRLLRRLVLNQSMDTPIPLGDDLGAPGSISTPVAAVKDIGDKLSSLWDESAAGLCKKIVDYMDAQIADRAGPLLFALALITGLVAVYAVRGSFWQKPTVENAKPLAILAPLSVAALSSVDVKVNEFSAKAQNANLDPAGTDKLRKFVEAKLRDIKGLYAARVQDASDFAGNMTVDLTIDELGNVTQIYERGASLIDLSFKKNILDEMQKWLFPGLNKGTLSISVVYGFANKSAPQPLPKSAARPTS